MKHLELKLKKRVLLVELSNGANKIKVFNDTESPYISYFIGTDTHRYYQPFCQLAEIGKLSELKEEDFSELVESKDRDVYTQDLGILTEVLYKDYREKDEMFEFNCDVLYSAKTIFESAVEAQGYYLKNPFDDRKLGMTFACEYQNRWQIAETQTFHPERTYIFEIKNTQ